jgi:hypothetical protein
MIFGQLPQTDTPATAETPPSEQPPTTTTTPPATPPSDDKMTVDRKYIESLRKEAEANRKALETFKAQQEQTEKDRKLAELSEIERLKAQAKDAEDRYTQAEKARKQEVTKAKLINIASSLDIPVPMFVVNQIPTDKLSEDLTDEDLKNMVQNVITEAEQAGMPLKRQRQAETPPPIAPSPGVGATNPPNAYPSPKLTNDQLLTQLKQNYVKASKEGNVIERQNIETRIRDINKQMGVIA